MLQGEDRLSKLLAQKGKRNVPKFCSPGRKMITVMTCISAAGSYLRPFIVFEGRKIPLQQLQQQVDPTLFDVGFSKRGGIDHELFSVWVEGLISYLDHHNIQRPVLLLLDSHTCHINLNTCEMAKEAGLIMHLLPPHANHLMQPVDVGIFKTLKAAYKDSVDYFIPTHGPAINKKHFPLVFVNAWRNAAIKDNAISGFREAGLVPLNPEMIDTTKIPTRPRFSSAALKSLKERAPGRPLHKGTKVPKRTQKPPGNEYIRGLSDALEHIIHNFVSDEIRPIYQQWINEQQSCTPDPVFYIWGSLKSLIGENLKKQMRCEKLANGQASSSKMGVLQPPRADDSVPSNANPSTSGQNSLESTSSSSTSVLHRQPYSYNQNNTGISPAAFSSSSSWQHTNGFGRYLNNGQQQPVTPESTSLQPTAANNLTSTNRPVTAAENVLPQQQALYYDATAKDVLKDPVLSGKSVKRQWQDSKEQPQMYKRRPEESKASQNTGDCNVYERGEPSNYSARNGMCIQDVVPQDLCQLHYDNQE